MERPIPAPRIGLRSKQCKPPIPVRRVDSMTPVSASAVFAEKSDMESDVWPSTSTEVSLINSFSPPELNFTLVTSTDRAAVSPPLVPQKPLRLSFCHLDCPSTSPPGSATSQCSSGSSPLALQKTNVGTLLPNSAQVSPSSSLTSDSNCDLSKPPPIPARKKPSRTQGHNSLPLPTLDNHLASEFKSLEVSEADSNEKNVGNSSDLPYLTQQQIDERFLFYSSGDWRAENSLHSELESQSSSDKQSVFVRDINGRNALSSARNYSNVLEDSAVRQSVNLIDLSDSAELPKAPEVVQYLETDTNELVNNGFVEEPFKNFGDIPLTNPTEPVNGLNVLPTPPPKPPLRQPEKALGLIKDCACMDTKLDLEEGLWNPRYIGLEEYRKLVEISDSIASNVDQDYSLPLYNELNNEEPESKRTSVDISNCTEQSAASSSIDGESVCFSGFVHLTVHKKSRGNLWAVLRHNKLSFYRSDDEEGGIIMGPYDLSNAVYVGQSPKNKIEVNLYIKENSLSVHWNHMVISTEQAEHWVFFIAKCFMPKHDILYHSVSNIDAGGVVWIRQGATCPWSEGWMHLDKRRLIYALESCVTLFELDVRKFIALKNDVPKVDWCAAVAGSQKGPFLLSLDGCSLYVQADNDTITNLWDEVLSAEMKKTSNKLEDHKLTADDVPIIVDKCIKYISTYGLRQPELYRRNGSKTKARYLMDELKKDPVNVHIAFGCDDMVYVVADVLKMFFRQLEAPLIPEIIQEQLIALSEKSDLSKLNEYHHLLMTLPRIRSQTLRKVMSHLKEVTEHADSNLATIGNIAKFFGPTLFSVDQDETSKFEGYTKTVQYVNVMKDLLENYAVIFRVSRHEIRVKSTVDLFQNKAGSIKARADGFLVPIHLREKDNYPFNVQSSLTAEQVCEAARHRPSFSDEGNGAYFALFEVIKSGQLERRVGWKEKMSTMVAGRWLDWDPTDCYLVFKRDLLPFSFDHLCAFANDVKMAEPGSKTFSTCHLELKAGTTIVHFNKSLKQVSEWNVDDLCWFTGHEASRKPPYQYTLTFIVLKKNFKYKSKFMGYCIAFRDEIGRMQWLNAALSSQQNFHTKPFC